MLFVKGFRFFPEVFETAIYPEVDNMNIFSDAREAIVEKTIYPNARGEIRCYGVFYKAQLYGADSRILCIGQRVRMIGICENVALVTDWVG